MAIWCEHVHRLELRKSNTSMPKATFISYSRISYFGYECLKLNFVLIFRSTDKCATQN